MTRALIKELVKRNEFAVAPALVERYAQLIVNRAKQQLQMMGIDVEGARRRRRCAKSCAARRRRRRAARS